VRARPRCFAPLAVLRTAGRLDCLVRGQRSSDRFSILIFAVANLIVYTDALDFALRLYMRRRNTVGSSGVSGSEQIKDISIDLDAIVPADSRLVVPVSPYAIICLGVSISKISLMSSSRHSGLIEIASGSSATGSTDNTVLRLTQAGWRCFDDGINRRKPGAIRRLLERIPSHIETIMVIDPDIRIRGRGEGGASSI